MTRGGGESRAGCRSLALLVAGQPGSAKFNLLSPGPALNQMGKPSTVRHSGSRRTSRPGIPGQHREEACNDNIGKLSKDSLTYLKSTPEDIRLIGLIGTEKREILSLFNSAKIPHDYVTYKFT